MTTPTEEAVAAAIAQAQSEWRNGSDADWTATLARAAINALAAQGGVTDECPSCGSPDEAWLLAGDIYCRDGWHEIDPKTRALLAQAQAVNLAKIARMEAAADSIADLLIAAEARIAELEATIKRVREVLDRHGLDPDEFFLLTDALRAALEGDNA